MWDSEGEIERMLDWPMKKEKVEVRRQLRYCGGFGYRTVHFTPEGVSGVGWCRGCSQVQVVWLHRELDKN